MRQCPVCGKEFATNRSFQLNCSPRCKKDKGVKPGFVILKNTGTVGAIGELLVSAELMKQGFDVFRALSPSAGTDLLAVKDASLFRFEVRTGQYKNGKVWCSKYKIRAENLVIITHVDNKLHFYPETPVEFKKLDRFVSDKSELI